MDCLAKTTVDLLIDPEKPLGKASKASTAVPVKQEITFQLHENSDSEMQHQQAQSDNQVPSVGSATADPLASSIGSGNANTPVGKNLNDTTLVENSNGSTMTTNTQNDGLNQDAGNEFKNFDSSFSEQNDHNAYKGTSEPIGIWLIAPLITKLQSTCHEKVLEYTGNFVTLRKLYL